MAANDEEHTAQNYISNVTGSIQKKVNILYRHFQLSWSQYRCINKCKATGQKKIPFLSLSSVALLTFPKSQDWITRLASCKTKELKDFCNTYKSVFTTLCGKSHLKKLPFLQFSILSLGNKKKIKILMVVNSRNVAIHFRASFLLSSYSWWCLQKCPHVCHSCSRITAQRYLAKSKKRC